MLHSDYAKTPVMFSSLLLNTLSSVVQLIKRREQGGSRYKEIITDGFGSACFSTSLSLCTSIIYDPPRSLHLPSRVICLDTWHACQVLRRTPGCPSAF